MIEADRRRPSRLIWLLVPITVVWTNLHGGFLALIAVLGLTAVGCAAETLLRRGGWARVLRYTSLTAACAAASLVNPYGYQLHLHVLDYLRSDWIRNVIQEFQSPSFRSENMLQFEVLLFAGADGGGLSAAPETGSRGIVDLVFCAHVAVERPARTGVCHRLFARDRFTRSATGTRMDRGSIEGSLLGIVNQMAADARKGFAAPVCGRRLLIAALAMMNQPLTWPADFPDEMFPTEDGPRPCGRDP